MRRKNFLFEEYSSALLSNLQTDNKAPVCAKIGNELLVDRWFADGAAAFSLRRRLLLLAGIDLGLFPARLRRLANRFLYY